MVRLSVTGPTLSYPLCIDRLDSLPQLIPADSRGVIVSNVTLAALYQERLAVILPGMPWVTIPDGEQYKTLETVSQLYDRFITAGLDRSGSVIAFGGGVVGDLAGFAAATYMRGVRFIQVPTTLLAMVDSSVGGKVGVDLPQGKNLVGAFKDPDLVLADVHLLATLPEVEWRCGMAEVLKHGLLADERLLDPALHTPENQAALVEAAVRVKIAVVQQDPYEQGIRAHLNLGHTFGHAIEQVTQYQWKHGLAVGLGLLAAVRLSYALSLCDAALVAQVEEVLLRAGLPRSIGTLEPEAIYAAMATDKKFRSGRSRFVLLRAVGEPVIVEEIPKSEVIRILEGLRSA